MKGLLLKDFYVTVRVGWYFAIFLVFWPLLLLAGAPPTMVIFACFMGSMLPATLTAYDERDKWPKYADTLPYTRKQLVTAKYIYGIIAIGIVIILSAVSMAINTLFIQEDNILTFGEMVFWCSVYLLGGAVTSLMHPFIFWLGAEKGRFVYMIFGGLCGGLGAISANSSSIISMSSQAMRVSSPVVYAAVIFVIAILLYAASWALSVMLYSKREL